MAYGRRGSLYMDPSFQAGLELGNAYGNMWAANAKNRQGEHAKDILEEMRQQQQIEEIANMNKLQEGPKEPQKAVSVTGNIPGYNGFSLSSATPDGRSVQENAVDEVLGLKSGGQYPIGQQEAADEKNVAAASDLQKVNLGFNPNFSVDEFKRRANERGLNKEVIDMYLPDVQKEATEQARNNLLPEIMDGLYGYTNEKGEYVAPTPESYRNANEKLILLKTYDPDTANPLLSGSITPRDIYNENRQNTVYSRTRQDLLTDRAEERSNKKQDVAEAFDLKVEQIMKAYPGMSREDAAKIVLGSGGRGRTNAADKSPLESAEYKEAKKIVEELNPDVLGRDLTAAEVNLQKQASAVLQAAREAAFGLSAQNGNKNAHEPDVNNYYQAIGFATDLFNRGATVEQAMSILRDKMGDGPMYRNIISAWITGGNAPNQPAAKQEGKLFEDWGPANTRTGVAAGDFGSNGYTFWDLAGRSRK